MNSSSGWLFVEKIYLSELLQSLVNAQEVSTERHGLEGVGISVLEHLFFRSRNEGVLDEGLDHRSLAVVVLAGGNDVTQLRLTEFDFLAKEVDHLLPELF